MAFLGFGRRDVSDGLQEPPVKARLTTWLIDQRRLGVDCPEVNSAMIRDSETRRPLPIRERADRFLQYLADRKPYPGSGFPGLSYEIDRENFIFALSAFESSVDLSAIDGQRREIGFFADYLEEQGWIESFKRRGNRGRRLTVAGHVRLAELEETHTPSSGAFIAMWFDETMNEAWDRGIVPAVRDAGYDRPQADLGDRLGPRPSVAGKPCPHRHRCPPNKARDHFGERPRARAVCVMTAAELQE